MTKLEEEMFFKMFGYLPSVDKEGNRVFDAMMYSEAKAAAEVAKQYIEKAAKDASIYALANGYHSSAQIERWMKENGITE